MEYFGVSLKSLLESADSQYLDQNQLEVITFNCLRAVDFLASANLLHRDIKPDNILLD